MGMALAGTIKLDSGVSKGTINIFGEYIYFRNAKTVNTLHGI